LRTDASLRFEKKLPPITARTAVGRILTLFSVAGYEHKVVSRLSSAGDAKDRTRPVQLPSGYVARRAGAAISDEESAQILQSIGFGCQPRADGGLDVAIPPFRGEFDIAIPEDISEEVMRLYGYDRITPELPPAPVRPTPPHRPSQNHHRARRVLAEGHRFVEAQSYCWFDDGWLKEIGYKPPRQTLDIRNPLAPDRRHMRESLLPNLLAFVLQNRRHAETFRLYELGRLFWIDEQGERQESNELAGIAVDQRSTQPETEFRAVKGALDDIATAAGLGPLQFVRMQPTDAPWTATQATLEIRLGDHRVGAMGTLTAALRKKVLDSGNAVWFQLAIDELAGPLFPAVACRAPNVFPGSWQDFTFVWNTAKGYLELESLLGKFEHPTVQTLEFVTVYTPKGEAESKYSFRFQIGWPDRTISAEDIQSFRDAFLAFAESNGLRIA
ncbi:MAG: hypothetical protein KDA75_08085, partial [Planctomycetaceae bacterium]|nr:hypothetical protein [Planctomycetaceae bacterium]